eukprot:GHRR01031503.1.p1 GENE.GHRR01031503.1~~GHRR01031503.1.p1  ORF type:complete len:106 (+),score=39.70 GHRR01031503.1:297-614(+)
MHPGQLMMLKLSHHTDKLLNFPDTAPPAIAALCTACWADDPTQRPTMRAVVDALNQVALDLLGEEVAVMVFPDVARALIAQRKEAAAIAAAAATQLAQDAGQWHV